MFLLCPCEFDVFLCDAAVTGSLHRKNPQEKKHCFSFAIYIYANRGPPSGFVAVSLSLSRACMQDHYTMHTLHLLFFSLHFSNVRTQLPLLSLSPSLFSCPNLADGFWSVSGCSPTVAAPVQTRASLLGCVIDSSGAGSQPFFSPMRLPESGVLRADVTGGGSSMELVTCARAFMRDAFLEDEKHCLRRRFPNF